MNNKIVYDLFYMFQQRGFTTLRFNFRGIGRSQGEFDHGAGELSDAASALDWVQALHPDPVAAAGLRETLMAAPDPKRAFQAVFVQALARWVSGEFDADYPETWAAFRARCSQALERLLDGLPRGDDALVFTSGGPIATLAQVGMAEQADRPCAVCFPT